MGRRRLVPLILAFLVTNAIGAFLAANESLYGTSYAHITYDPTLYASWADEILHEHTHPYSGVEIEYPPGVMPFAILPEVGDPSARTYLIRFVALMVLVNIAAFSALLLLARRYGSLLGPWLWIGGTVALGPIIFTRLDLIPAAATLWALERASARSWFGAGGWFSFGVLTKIYPLVLMPLALAVAVRRRQFIAGAALVAGVVLLPYVGSLADMYHSVFGFHGARGIHVESSWGAMLLTAGRFGYEAAVTLSFGAFHVDAGLTGLLKVLGNVCSIAALGVGMFLTLRHVERGDVPKMAAAMYGTLAVILSVGTVFSPQFVIWLLAFAAAAACAPLRLMRGPMLTLLPVAAVTQVIYPFIYELLLQEAPSAIAALLSRNLLVLIAGIGAWSALPHETFPSAAAVSEGPPAPSLALGGPSKRNDP